MSNTTTKQIAKQLKEFYYGKNWTWSYLAEALEGVDWKMAVTKIESFNTIAVLVYHLNYYLGQQIKVFKGGPLEGSDKLSFELPSISSEEDWQNLQKQVYKQADEWVSLVEKLDDSILPKVFVDKKYGSYYRNLLGAVEHSHYHLGQIVIFKKLLKK